MDPSHKFYPETPTRVDGFFTDHLLFFETDSPFTKAEAFVGILVAAAISQGDMSIDEEIALFVFLKQTKTLKKFSGKEISRMMKKMFTHKEDKGFDSLLDHSIAFYSKTPRLRIYKDACTVIFSIKEGHTSEKKFLEDLQIGMGLSQIKTLRIQEKVKLKAAA